VLGRDGRRIGHVEGLVVDEGAHQVTHLVVGQRALPLREFRDAGPDGLATDLGGEADLERFPSHADEQFGPPGEHWQPPEGWAIHNFLAVAGALLGNAPYQPPVEAELKPGESGHEITSGSPVWVEDRQIGHVVEVLTDERGRTRDIVMARAGLRGEKVLIPVQKVIEVVGPNVQVDLNETEVELLEPYEG